MASGETISWKYMCDKLKELYPEYPISQDLEEKGTKVTFSNQLSKDLGIGEYRSLEEMLKDSVESLIRVGAIPDKRQHK